MKRAKIMLTSLVVLAVVGGALAFKAQKFSQKKVFCSNASVQEGPCTMSTYETSILTNAGAFDFQSYCTDDPIGTCTETLKVTTTNLD